MDIKYGKYNFLVKNINIYIIKVIFIIILIGNRKWDYIIIFNIYFIILSIYFL